MPNTTISENMFQQFLNQVAKTPKDIAIVSEKGNVSFSQLKLRVEVIAQNLIRMNVGKGDFVGIYLHRSVDAIAAMLAILAVGAAYVFLDIKLPKNRINEIISDAACTLIITISSLKKLHDEMDVLLLDEVNFSHDNESDFSFIRAGGNTAYLIYTSGSTGKPKGVMISHQNALSMLAWAADFYSYKERSGILAATSFCFDLSIFEVFLPLLFGGKIVLVEDILEIAKKNFLKTKIRLINTVPSAINELVSLGKIPDSVITINLAGEPLRQSLVNELYKIPGIEKIYNLYAPSETTTYSTIYLASCKGGMANVSVGRPIKGTCVLILDKFMNPVPYFVKGEIYIVGKGVAQGYLNKPELTKEKFIEHSFNRNIITRLYRTGDYGRMHPDGNIEFMGRLDHQIKIRGFRLELGEVETYLLLLPQVKEAIVEVIDSQDNKVLVVYYSADSLISSDILRQHLKKYLPTYAIPSEFNYIGELPRTITGKIDRAELEKFREVQDIESDDFESGEDSEEFQMLMTIWRYLLPDKKISLESNFFYIGGHSLLATRLVSSIQKEFNIQVSLPEIFNKPIFKEQLEYICSKSNYGETHFSKIKKTSRQVNVPLSYQQQRMWFLEQMHPDKAISNIPCVIKIHGEVNTNALEKALGDLIYRHKALRTFYYNYQGMAVQSVFEDFCFKLNKIDFHDKKLSDIKKIIYKECHLRFDYTKDLLLRATLINVDKNEYILVLTLHHLSADAWSLNILAQDISLLYKVHCYGKSVKLPEVVVDYIDYALWQKSYLSGGRLNQSLDYWVYQLSGARSSNPLLFNRLRPDVKIYEGSFESVAISYDFTKKIKYFCQEQGVTLFMFLLTGFYLLLYLYSYQDDISVGTPIANRIHPDVENTIGFFANSLVLRIQIEISETIKSLLKKVRSMALEAYEHQEMPFEKLVEYFGLQGDNTKNPFFQVFFALQSTLPKQFSLPEAETKIIDFDRKISKFDLTFSFQEQESGIHGVVEYSTDLFNKEIIQRLIMQYKNILKKIVEDVDSSISSFSIVSSVEYNKVVYDWNKTETDYPKKMSVVSLFEKIVALYPKKVAIVDDKKELTYTDLNKESNRYANFLKDVGIQPGVAVGLFLDRSIKIFVSILGILKAGAYYVPLATDLPEERLDYIIKDSGVKYIVTNTNLANKLPVSDVNILCLDELQNEINKKSTDNLSLLGNGSDPIYLVYTSGTTGDPKGVLALHHNVTRLVRNTNYVDLSVNSVFLQISPVSFDGATFEIWGSLLNGGKLVLMPSSVPELSKIIDLIYRFQVNTMFVTTQIFNALVDYYVDTIVRLDVLLFGGEMASVDHVKKFLSANKKCQLCNIYGPTEGTTYSSYYPITEIRDSIIPIGKPIANTAMYILNADQKPVPVGAVGEIYIGGEGLAKEYINKSDLTSKKFVMINFDDGKIRRLYKTGDLGYFDEDGNIYFIGRRDNQIKRSGYRIELEEIESCMRLFASINECVVVYDNARDLLTAYFTLSENMYYDENLIKRQLLKKLPHYMVPDKFIVRECLPLNTSGKIDRCALADIMENEQGVESKLSGQSTGLESIIFNIWSDVLGFNDFTIEDNFFDMGGSSLKMVHVLDQLQQKLKKESHQKIPEMVDLFAYPTISALAEFLSGNDEDMLNKTALYADKRKSKIKM